MQQHGLLEWLGIVGCSNLSSQQSLQDAMPTVGTLARIPSWFATDWICASTHSFPLLGRCTPGEVLDGTFRFASGHERRVSLLFPAVSH
jgi:hypothetical protein